MPIRIIKHEAVPQFYLRRLTLLRTRTKCFDPVGAVPPFVPRKSRPMLSGPVAIPVAKADSEIFNKFGPASFSDREVYNA